MDRVRVIRRRQFFDDLEFDFHPLRTDTFDVDRDRVPGVQPFPGVRQTGEVGCQFDETAVLFDAADNAPDRFPRSKAAGIFQPGAQQLPVGHGDAALFPVNGAHRR